MDCLVNDARAYIFRLIGAAYRIVCCSVSKTWYKYAISVSSESHQHCYDIQKDVADFTRDEFAAMLGDFHLFCRIKPQIDINVHTACAGGSAQVALRVMVSRGVIQFDKDTPTVDHNSFTAIYNGAFKSGSPQMLDMAQKLCLTDNIDWNTDDVVRGGMIDAWLSLVEANHHNYNNLFTSACKFASVDVVKYVYDLVLAAANVYVEPANLVDHEPYADYGSWLVRPKKIATRMPNNTRIIDDICKHTNIPKYMLHNVAQTGKETKPTDDILYHIDNKFDMQRLARDGLIAALSVKRLGVAEFVSALIVDNNSTNRSFNTGPVVVRHYRAIALMLAHFDDIEYFDKVTVFYPIGLPEMCLVDCTNIITELLRRLRDSGQLTDECIDRAMLIAIQYGNHLTLKVLLNNHTPSLRQLNMYLSAACNAGYGIEHFVNRGAVICDCGSRH